jgi:hypothetical protein
MINRNIIFHTVAIIVCALPYAALPLLFTSCSSGTPIEEGTYVGGLQTQQAVVEAEPGGGYKTISGDPLIAMNGYIEPESMLPYGGGDSGIRQAEDETPFYSTN